MVKWSIRFGIHFATCQPILGFLTFFLIFKYCILWNSMNSEINLEWNLIVRSRSLYSFFCSCCGCLGSAPLQVSLCSPWRLAAAAAVAAAVISRHLRIFFRAGRPRRRKSLIQSFLSILGYRFFDAIGQHLIVNNNGVRPCLPKYQSLFLCLGQMDPVDGVLRVFPLALTMNFLGFDRSPSDSSPRCEEYSLSPFLLSFTSQRIYVVREASYKNPRNHQTWLFMARILVQHVKSSTEERKTGMIDWKTKAR